MYPTEEVLVFSDLCVEPVEDEQIYWLVIDRPTGAHYTAAAGPAGRRRAVRQIADGTARRHLARLAALAFVELARECGLAAALEVRPKVTLRR